MCVCGWRGTTYALLYMPSEGKCWNVHVVGGLGNSLAEMESKVVMGV